jgi:hypothetical protein
MLAFTLILLADTGRASAPRHHPASSHPAPGATTVAFMCRNITMLRGLQPSATHEEIEAAARQYVRKVSGVQNPTAATRDPFEAAVAEVARVTAALLAELPDRRQPPPTLPPLRRPEVRARLAAREAAARSAGEAAGRPGQPG